MPEDYKKKLEEAGKQYSEALKSSSELTAEDIAGMTRMAQDKAQRIADQQYLDESDSINRLAKAQGAAEKSGADMLIEMGNQMRNTQKEGEAQVEADNRAATWTGAAELAASIANMIGVGSFGAVSQQYKSYSQDWMKKADADMREHRSRMDNLNERLRQQKAKLDALKLGNAQTLEGMRQRAAANQAQANQTINNMGLQGGMRAAEIQGQARDKAAQVDYNTQSSVAQMGFQASENAKNRALRESLSNSGSGSTSSSSSSSSGRGGTTGDSYEVVIDGNNTTLKMSKETYAQGIMSGTEELKEDLADNAKKALQAAGISVEGDLTFADLSKLASEKKIEKVVDGKRVKVDNPLYGKDTEIIKALSGSSGDTPADYEVIERFVKDNKSKVNKFNKHLKRVSNSPDAAAGVQPTKGTWEDDFND